MAARSATRSIFAARNQYSRSYGRLQHMLRSHGQRNLQAAARKFSGNPNVSSLDGVPLALLASSIALTAQADASPLQPEEFTPLSRIESHTGVSFPTSLSSKEILSGVGARYMGGLVKVYAVGVYLDERAARTALADWKGFTAEDIVTSDPLWKEICSSGVGFPRTVRMVVVRNVHGKHMQDGFERALLGRVASMARQGRCRPKESKAAAKKFCALFTTVGTMKVGSDIRITVDQDIVTLVIDGRFVGKIQNKQLAWAVLDMFIGDKSVVSGLREEVARGLEVLLQD